MGLCVSVVLWSRRVRLELRYEFSLGSEPSQLYVLSMGDLKRTFFSFMVQMALGLVLTVLFFAGLPRGARARGFGCFGSPLRVSVGVRSTIRGASTSLRIDLKRGAWTRMVGDGTATMRRFGATSFFYSRLLAVPVVSLFALVLIRCGLVSMFSLSSSQLQNSDFLMLGISFLLGMSGGALASRLIDLGKSGVSPAGGARGSGA